MSKREKDIFQITKSIGDEELGFAYDVIGKLLSDHTEEDLRKEMALVREDAQVQILSVEERQKELTRISIDHQKLNGELREDNKKLSKQIDDYLQKKVNGLRKSGMWYTVWMTKAKYGYSHIKKTHKKLRRHSKNPNKKSHTKKYRGQGR